MRERARARVAESILANGITQETPVILGYDDGVHRRRVASRVRAAAPEGVYRMAKQAFVR